MKKMNNKELQNVVRPGITHLMMWFGGELPEKRRIVYRPGQKLSYQACRDDEKTIIPGVP